MLKSKTSVSDLLFLARSRAAPVGCALTFLWLGFGCVTPIIRPVVPPAPVESPEHIRQKATMEHLIGEWSSSNKSGKITRMIFSPGGQLAFQGGMEYYNPGQWSIDASRQELKIRLPQADVDKLSIFKLYVGQGIQAFNPSQKEMTYRFDAETWTLIFAGWEFAKVDKTKSESLAEPVFK